MDISQSINRKENQDLPSNTDNINPFRINKYHIPCNYTFPQLSNPYNINPFPIITNQFIYNSEKDNIYIFTLKMKKNIYIAFISFLKTKKFYEHCFKD